ncbi:hypothetical protein BHM03_00062862, partial [Ensete ventricosum]
MISQKNSTIIYLREVVRRVKFRSVFRAPSRKFKILAIPDALAHGKSYEHGLAKKLDSHILCANHVQSRVSINFSCIIPKFKILAIPDVLAHGIFELRSVFRAPSRKFKILAISDVLAHGKLYKHGFIKKVTAINFVRTNPNVLAHGKSYEHGFVKNATVINFTQSCVQSRVSIGFTCTVLEIQNTGHSRRISQWYSRVSIGFLSTVSEIQNTGHSRRISPWEVVRARFHEKRDGHKLCVKSHAVEFRSVFRAPPQKFKILAIPDSRVSIGFSCTILKIQNTDHSRRISAWEVIRAQFHEK